MGGVGGEVKGNGKCETQSAELPQGEATRTKPVSEPQPPLAGGGHWQGGNGHPPLCSRRGGKTMSPKGVDRGMTQLGGRWWALWWGKGVAETGCARDLS